MAEVVDISYRDGRLTVKLRTNPNAEVHALSVNAPILYAEPVRQRCTFCSPPQDLGMWEWDLVVPGRGAPWARVEVLRPPGLDDLVFP